MFIIRSGAAIVAALTLALFGGCGGTSGSAGQARLAGVSLQKSQQGQSGGVADYDGDGIEDLFVGAPFAASGDGTGAVIVYKGTKNGFLTNPTWVLTGDDNFGYTFAGLGDVDGDGIGEFAVGALNGDGADVSLSGNVTVFKGGGRGKIIAVLSGEAALDKFGLAVKGGCDLNGDGIKDLVVGAPYHSPGADRYQGGAVYVYFGPDFDGESRVKLGATTDRTGLGTSVTCGDVNGDGIGDVVVGATGKVLVYYGGPEFDPRTDSPDVTVSCTDSKFGGSLAVLPDLDGDDISEIAIGAPNATASLGGANRARVGRLYIVKGGTGSRTIMLALDGATPKQSSDLLTWIDGASWFDRFGFAISTTGDVDGDGKADLAVSAIFADRAGAVSAATGLTSGRVYLLRSGNMKKDGTATPISLCTAYDGSDWNMQYGNFLCPFERNGHKLLVGAPTVNRLSGTVCGLDLRNGTSAAPIFSAGGPGNSTTDHDCCD